MALAYVSDMIDQVPFEFQWSPDPRYTPYIQPVYIYRLEEYDNKYDKNLLRLLAWKATIDHLTT